MGPFGAKMLNFPIISYEFPTNHTMPGLAQVNASAGAELRLHLVDDAKRSMVAHGQVSTYRPPRGHEDAGQIQMPKIC